MKPPFMIAAVVVAFALLGGAALSAQDIPFDRELLLDATPMRPSKRMPSVTISPNGRAVIDLWCRSVTGRLEFGEGTIAVSVDVAPQEMAQQPLPQWMTPGQCSEPRVSADEELLGALLQATSWRRERDALVLSGGPRPLRFRAATN